MLEQFFWSGNSKVGINMERMLDFIIKGDGDSRRLELRNTEESGRTITDQEDIDGSLEVANITGRLS